MQAIRLRPAPHSSAVIHSYSLEVTPKNHSLHWQQDPVGNWIAQAVFPEKMEVFAVRVELTAEIHPINPFNFFLENDATHFPFSYQPLLKEELHPYLKIREEGALLRQWAEAAQQDKAPIVVFIADINRRLFEAVEYIQREEPGVQTSEETLSLKSGTCRDMAWLMCQILRHLGLASRFVSGYRIQLGPDGKLLEKPTDSDDLHAWAEVYLPGAGWLGLDPTTGLLTSEGYIPLCASHDPASAAPVSGKMEACNSTLRHEIIVKQL